MKTALLNYKNCLVEVYAQDEINSFDVGYLFDVDEDWVLLKSYDRYGKYDGYMLLRLETIFKINSKTLYLENIERLITDKNSHNLKLNDGLLVSALNYIREKSVASIILDNGDAIIGKIKSFDETCITVEVYTDCGIKDGNSLIFIDSISTIIFENRGCIDIQNNIK